MSRDLKAPSSSEEGVGGGAAAKVKLETIRMFIVVFRNRKRADIDGAAYGADAGRMEAMARAQPGFVSFKSYTAEDGEVIALSEWASADAARDWGSQPDHAQVQARGRMDYYQEYTLYTCDQPRTHRYERPGG